MGGRGEIRCAFAGKYYAGFKRLRLNTDTIKFLSVGEFSAFMRQIKSRRDRAIFLIAYRHGLRVSELCSLKLGDINLDAREIRVRRQKKSKQNVTSMESDEVSALRAYLRTKKRTTADFVFVSCFGSPFHRNSLNRMMIKYGTAAGIPRDKLHFHVLKHSIATHLLAKTGNIRFVQSWIGHKDIRNTAVYADLTSETLRKESKSAFSKLPRFK